MTVQGILKRKGRGVVTIESDTPVGTAICLMRHRNVGALVVSKNGRDVEGLVCERDLIRALKSHGVGRLMPMTVADIMCREVASCRPDEDLRRVMTRMSARRAHHMPVVNDNGLCGIVSMAEIVKRRLTEAKEDAAFLRESIPVPG
ncbi:MAG: CBS domain-containing protein [Alphaproteobacteria bacterium]|nr:CBS domain-containing protein [Alphaproteobacteria bacterium]